MQRRFSVFLICCVLFILTFKLILMPDSRGGIIQFVLGQIDTGPYSVQRDIPAEGGNEEPYRVEVTIDTSNPVAVTSEKFVSFSIDTSAVVGGKWWTPEADGKEFWSGTEKAKPVDFNDPALNKLTLNLSPAYLRFGGSESDKMYYDLSTENLFTDKIPDGYESVLTRKRWDKVNSFAADNNLDLIFALNCGPSSRNTDKSWNGNNAKEIVKYSKEQNYNIAAWELGNELNIFWYMFGPGNFIKPQQFNLDIQKARKIINSYYPESDFNGQASLFWPVIGEPLSRFYGFTEEYIRITADKIDKIQWHYYPQQSRRGPVATRRANPYRMLNPSYLDEVAYWAEKIKSWRDMYAQGKEIWMGETANAQFGGEPGVSDVYIGGLWWLDQLGLLALTGHDVVIRQTLIGLDYGLIDSDTLKPRPDYWNSLLWKRLMGTEVFKVKKSGHNSEKLRVYVHSTPEKERSYLTLLAINLDHEKNSILSIPELRGQKYEVYTLTTNDILSDELLLNGSKLKLDKNYEIPEIKGIVNRPEFEPVVNISPLSYVFVKFYK